MNEEIVVFDCGKRFGLKAIHIEEIIMPDTVISLPLNLPAIEGLISVRDAVLPLINLKAFFGYSDDRHSTDDDTRFIIVKEGGLSAALRVNRIVGLMPLTATSPPPEAMESWNDREKTFVSDIATLEDGAMVMLPALNIMLDDLKATSQHVIDAY